MNKKTCGYCHKEAEGNYQHNRQDICDACQDIDPEDPTTVYHSSCKYCGGEGIEPGCEEDEYGTVVETEKPCRHCTDSQKLLKQLNLMPNEIERVKDLAGQCDDIGSLLTVLTRVQDEADRELNLYYQERLQWQN